MPAQLFTKLFLLIIPVVAASAGCSIIHAAKLPPKRNMDVLCMGTPRSNVVAEFGTPVSSEVHDKTRTDVFAFKQGYSKPVKAGRMVAHGAADILTYGLWELVGTPSELYFDGTDVQLSVNYDATDKVESVDILKGADVVHKTKKKPLFRKKASEPVMELASPDVKTVR